MQIQVLGYFGVRTGAERPASVPRLVARVGCMLAGWPGEWVERQRLITELWGERAPRTAVNTLQAHVSQLRKVLGTDQLIADANGYLLDVDPRIVDAELFQELIEEGARAQRQLHLARATELLGQALSLWNGTPYADVTDVDLRARRARLEELRELALEDLLACKVEIARDHHELHMLAAEARELVSVQPLRERRHALLIRALVAAHRVAEAHAALDDATQHIRLVTGGEPGPELSTIADALRGSAEDLAQLPSTFANPSASTPLRSQEKTFAAIADRVSQVLVEHDAPLVIVHAEPGDHEGLAAYVADRLQGDFPRGINIEGDLQSSSTAVRLEVPPQRGTLTIVTITDADTLIRFLRSRPRNGEPTLCITDQNPPHEYRAITISARTTPDLHLLRLS